MNEFGHRAQDGKMTEVRYGKHDDRGFERLNLHPTGDETKVTESRGLRVSCAADTVYLVVPCFDEEEQLPITADMLLKKMRQLREEGFLGAGSRVLFVDDGSRDATWAIIRSLNQKEPRIFSGIRLAHNVGHQNAVYAGLMEALAVGCEAAISLDADLQDDINVIDKMLGDFKSGSDIVFGVRSARKTDTWFKHFTAEAFYWLYERLGAQTVRDHADFRLMSKRAMEALSEYTEVNLFLRGIVPAIGLNTSIVLYERGTRAAGESKYSLQKMFSLAFQGITSFSVKPLRIVTCAGLVALLVSIVLAGYIIVSLAEHTAVPGWGSVMLSLWFIGGILMEGLGIIGEYVGKIYLETKHRPRYFIQERLREDTCDYR